MSCKTTCACLCQQISCGCHEGPPPKPRPKSAAAERGAAYARANPVQLTPEQIEEAARILATVEPPVAPPLVEAVPEEDAA